MTQFEFMRIKYTKIFIEFNQMLLKHGLNRDK